MDVIPAPINANAPSVTISNVVVTTAGKEEIIKKIDIH